MGWIDLLNKAFPEPKPRKKKKLKNWVENPKHFEYDLNKQQEKRRRIRNKLKEEALIKSKYIYADRESKENKLAREKRVDRKIERIKKKSEEKLKPADDYLTDRIKEADERAFWIWQRKEKKYSEEELAQANNEITNLYETIFERLIRMKYISRDPKIRKEQMDSLSDWIRYLKNDVQYWQ
jgi:outer membrane protein assembly factor BamA